MEMTVKEKLEVHFKVIFWHLLKKERREEGRQEGRQKRNEEQVFN